MNKITSEPGFTLVEILVVLTLLGGALVLVVPRVERTMEVSQLRASARALFAAADRARGMARDSGREVALYIDVREPGYRIDQGDTEPIMPETTRVVMTGARSEMFSRSSMAIRFFPDGSATGGRIVLAHRQQQLTLDVDWLTGAPRLGP